MSLFENAIRSIRLGLEDFELDDDARLLSAVRNLGAGILLLYKTKLSELSPKGSEDSLIKKQVIPKRNGQGEIVWVGSGKRTVDVSEIQERFKSLGITTNWERLNKITALRNDIEHHYTTSARDAIRGMISDCFVIVRDFIANELGRDPMVELGPEAWASLVSVSEVIEKERGFCKIQMEKVDWRSSELEEAIPKIECQKCGSPLLSPVGEDRESGIKCRSCGAEEDFESATERALAESLGWKNHFAIKDGGEEVLVTCPFCYQDTYIVEERACAVCGETCADTCDLCGNSIPTCEYSDGRLCGYCDHLLSKDD